MKLIIVEEPFFLIITSILGSFDLHACPGVERKIFKEIMYFAQYMTNMAMPGLVSIRTSATGFMKFWYSLII